jgi:hypothetical protein
MEVENRHVARSPPAEQRTRHTVRPHSNATSRDLRTAPHAHGILPTAIVPVVQRCRRIKVFSNSFIYTISLAQL